MTIAKKGTDTAFAKQMGKGRPKGVVNKNTAALKELILVAMDKSGGVEYLVKQAEENPNAFLSLIGKVLPLTVVGDMKHTITGIDVTIHR